MQVKTKGAIDVMRSMAIKINLSREDQKRLNGILQEIGYPSQRRKFHCTFGFINQMIPEEEVSPFGKMMTEHLQDHISSEDLFYEVEKAEHLFGHVIAFTPTNTSFVRLKEINQWVFYEVKKMSGDAWTLSKETEPSGFIPHLMLWRSGRLDKRFEKVRQIGQSHPSYQLSEVAYVIF